MRVIISPEDVAPIAFFHRTLPVPQADAVAAARRHIEALTRVADEAEVRLDEAKEAAATASRDAGSLIQSLHELESVKTPADVKLALSENTLVLARTDEAKTHAAEQTEKAAVAAAQAHSQFDATKEEIKKKLEAAAAAREAVKAAETRRRKR